MSHEHWDGKHWRGEPYVPEHQGEIFLTQVNPVSTQLYGSAPLDVATANVRIYGILIYTAFAAGQPTLLEAVVTIDGQTIIYQIANPANGQGYVALMDLNAADNAQLLSNQGANDPTKYRSFLLEGRSVQVQARVTWAANQPTPLILRVKWAQW